MLSSPIEAFMQMAQARNQNRRQAMQDAQGIGENIGGGITDIVGKIKEQRQKAAWQKTINEMMVNPNMAPGMKAMMPAIGQIGGQNPAVAGEMMAAFGKSAGQKANYRPVPGMLSKGGHPMVINEMTGEMTESGLNAAPNKSQYGTDLSSVNWEGFSPQEQDFYKQVYEGNIRPSDIGYRERSKAMLGASMYGQRNNLPPFQSFTGDIKKKSGEAFTSGKPAMNVLSLNTALGHIGSAADAYEKIGNVDQKWLNKPLNALRRETSDPNIIRLGITLNAVRGELATTFKGTGGTDQEIASWRDYLTDDLTPSQINAALPQVDELLRSRLSALEYSRSQATSNRPGQGAVLSPHARGVSNKLQKMDKGNTSGAPPVGTVEGGFRFKGGDPADPRSWVKQ